MAEKIYQKGRRPFPRIVNTVSDSQNNCDDWLQHKPEAEWAPKSGRYAIQYVPREAHRLFLSRDSVQAQIGRLYLLQPGARDKKSQVTRTGISLPGGNPSLQPLL